MPLPRREIDEIVQLHVREGIELQEVFVEGNEDKYFYETFLAARGLGHVAVLDVDTVDVPDGEVLRIGQKLHSKKGRVVTLAALLEGRLAENQVVCIADADLDHFKDTAYPYSLLLLTDHSSIELYVCSPTVFPRVLAVALGGFPKSHAQVMVELADILQDAFIVRLASDELNFAPTFPKHSSFCKVNKSTKLPIFNLTDYINKAFERHTDKTWRAPLNAKIEELRERTHADTRLRMHGHDFVETFAWYVRQHPGYGDLNAPTFARLILGFVDADTLEREPLFQELLRRLRSTARFDPQ